MSENTANRNHMSNTEDKITTYEKLINKISGIASVKIITDSNHAILECHVLADYSRNVKQIVRDIQSALVAKHNYVIDYKVISIAQIDPEKMPIESSSYRVIVDRLDISYINNNMEVNAIITKNSKQYVGTAVGGSNLKRRLKTVALAVVDSINKMLNVKYYDLSFICKTTISGTDIILVSIETRDDSILIGAVPIRADENNAVVCAVFDAVNRTLPPLLEQSSD